MPRPSKPVPSYRLHKQSGQAVVTLRINGTRKDGLLGRYGSPESRAEYQRVLAELQTGAPGLLGLARSSAAVADPTVNEVLLAFMNWAETHYRDTAGEPTTEVGELKWSVKLVRELYGHTSASRFGPRSLAAVRQKMIDCGWCRSLINRRVDRIKRVFKWAASEELVPVTVYQGLRTVSGLQRGRTTARESQPVKPVEAENVVAILPILNRHVRAMVELQRLTGMRPGEVCAISFKQIDRTGDRWFYRPTQHKTAHRGKERVIPLGPRARAALTTFLVGESPPPPLHFTPNLGDPSSRKTAARLFEAAGRHDDAQLLRDAARPLEVVSGCIVDPDKCVFSPAAERKERFKRMRAARKTRVQPSQLNRRKPNPGRVPADRYLPHAYAHAIAAACKKAGIPRWHPNQLRHSFATEVRRAHGLEAAQVLLGHAQANVTQVYAERDLALAESVATKIG